MESFDVKQLLTTLMPETFLKKNEKGVNIVIDKYKISIGYIYLRRYVEDLILSRDIISQNKFYDCMTRIMQRCLPNIAEYYSFNSYSCFSEKSYSAMNMIKFILNYLYFNNSEDQMIPFLKTIFTIPTIDWDNICYFDDNYKKQLMIHYQRKFEGKFPVYGLHESEKTEKESSGVSKPRVFRAFVYCPLKKEIWGEGSGLKKKAAEKEAAKNALIRLGLLS